MFAAVVWNRETDRETGRGRPGRNWEAQPGIESGSCRCRLHRKAFFVLEIFSVHDFCNSFDPPRVRKGEIDMNCSGNTSNLYMKLNKIDDKKKIQVICVLVTHSDPTPCFFLPLFISFDLFVKQIILFFFYYYYLVWLRSFKFLSWFFFSVFPFWKILILTLKTVVTIQNSV